MFVNNKKGCSITPSTFILKDGRTGNRGITHRIISGTDMQASARIRDVQASIAFSLVNGQGQSAHTPRELQENSASCTGLVMLLSHAVLEGALSGRLALF